MVQKNMPFLIFFLMFFSFSCSTTPTEKPLPIKTAQAIMYDTQHKELGTITLTSTDQGVRFTLNLEGLPEGSHGFHIHEKGVCEGPGFQSAGGHFNPLKKHHGLEHKKGAHAGDMPNLNVTHEGKVQTSIDNNSVTLTPSPTSLMDPAPTSIIIHALADDQHSNPAGNSGDRIACGVIQWNTKE